MARKADPNDVIDDFQSLLAASRRSFNQTTRRVRRATLQKQEAIDTFLRAAVAFETFRSEWHIAAVNRDSSVFRAAVHESIKKTIKNAREYRGAADLIKVNLDRHPRVSVIRGLVDPLGRNVAFPDGWRARAELELASPYRDKILAFTAHQLAVVAAVVAIRNAIAHRSTNAVAEMNSALTHLPAGLRRGTRRVRITGLGTYLWASAPGRVDARVETFYDELHSLAEALRT